MYDISCYPLYDNKKPVITTGTIIELVEVLRAYSNRADLLEDLRTLAGELDEAPTGTKMGGQMTNGQTTSKRLSARLSVEDVQTILHDLATGATRDQVAMKFGISVRSVARLRKKHKRD